MTATNHWPRTSRTATKTTMPIRGRVLASRNNSDMAGPIELTDEAIRKASPLPRTGRHNATVTGTRELSLRDGRLLIAVSLQTADGVQFDDLQTVQAPNPNPYVQAGLKRIRNYVEIAEPNADLTDLNACLEAIEGCKVEVDIEHYQDRFGDHKAKVTTVRSDENHARDEIESNSVN